MPTLPAALRLCLPRRPATCPPAYVTPFAVGEVLPNLALFLDKEYWVEIPLEQTYQATWDVLPQINRDHVTAAGQSA